MEVAALEEELHDQERHEMALSRGDLPRPQQEAVCATLNLLKELVSGAKSVTILLMEEEDQKAHLQDQPLLAKSLEALRNLAQDRWAWLCRLWRENFCSYLVTLIRTGVLAQVKGAALACLGQMAGHPRLSSRVWEALESIYVSLLPCRGWVAAALRTLHSSPS